MDNGSLCNTWRRTLDVECPTLIGLNRLPAQTIFVIDGTSTSRQIAEWGSQGVVTSRLAGPRRSFSAETAHREQLSATDVAMSLSEHDLKMVTCDPRHGRCMACCLRYRGDVAPKNVNAVAVMIKTRCTTQHGANAKLECEEELVVYFSWCRRHPLRHGGQYRQFDR